MKIEMAAFIRELPYQIAWVMRGQPVQLVKIEHRVQVYYCQTLIRELDLDNQRSTIVDRWLSD